ncbi:MAG: 16S rRNA (cytidine(1402)-2'-O)-methyltransferase [Nitrospira sp.]|nr:16S rRNA (cytidine(1402)-2'-O)-methyltransferase [Nitrospira sp.]
MRREQSQQSEPVEYNARLRRKPGGSLYLIGVPIGHPDDITLRALDRLGRVDIVATEDPRATEALLRHHHLATRLTSYGPTKIKEKVAVLIDRLQQGASVALLSDCGSPVISDPGSLLVAAAHKHSIPVFSIPGPSAVTAAIAASGFSAEAFYFYGNITAPTRPGKNWLAPILARAEPTIVFCQTKSCLAILATIAKTAPRRRIALACDLTLQGETVFKGTARHVSTLLKRIQPPQAVTIIVGGRKLGAAEKMGTP